MTQVYIISVVLNDQAGLARTAQSVLGQVDSDITWVIADGGSIDGSISLAEHLEANHARVILLRGPDQGIYHGMNRALAVVPDDALVWFLNAGDILLSEHSVSKAVEITPQAGWSGGPMVLVGESGAIHDITSVPTLAASRGRPGLHLPAQPTILMAKELYGQGAPFREDLRYASDGVFYQGVAQQLLPVVRQEPLVAFTLGGRSSRHYRQTLLEFWSAGFRPRRISARLRDRDLGQFRTWMRAMKLDLLQRVRSGGSPGMAAELPFDHWTDHRRTGPGLECCLRMGRGLVGLEGRS